MNPYDWIIFDSTGTLMTPDPEPAVAYHAFGSDSGSRRSVDQIRGDLKAAMRRHFFGETALNPTDESAELVRWKRIVADTLPDIPRDAFEPMFGKLWNHFASSAAWRLYDDVLPTIDRLRKKGYSIGIGSNFDRRLPMVLEGKGVIERFDQVLTSSDLGWSKPNPKFYEVATSRLGAQDRSRLLMIGDTERGDVTAPRESGWHARLLVRDGDGALLNLTNDL